MRYIVKLRKTAESACRRLQRISRIRDKLLPLLAALFFLITLILIAVIIWLSLSIHLINNNNNNIRTACILEELVFKRENDQWRPPEKSSTGFLGENGKNQSNSTRIPKRNDDKNLDPCVEVLKILSEHT